ncbi:hypothetical protein AOLI_G00264730 [Acnodon oligacanthus]
MLPTEVSHFDRISRVHRRQYFSATHHEFCLKTLGRSGEPHSPARDEVIFKYKPTTVCNTLGKADIWLARTYWDFEYPRPLLLNFKSVRGLQCKPAKPLPKEMEEFVQSSGDDGIVVFSLGSMMKNLHKERANTIASALGQIPLKVVWRGLKTLHSQKKRVSFNFICQVQRENHEAFLNSP